MIEFIFKVLFPLIKKQAIGFLVGFVVAAVFFHWYYWEEITNYNNYGSCIGEYKIKIGEHKTITSDKFEIGFSTTTYNDLNELYYPYIYFYTSNKVDESFRRMPLNEQYFFKSEDYYYMARLIALEEGKDTTATFEVFRKEYPTIEPSNP